MPAPDQIGTQLYSVFPPKFVGFHVVGGTYKEKDATKSVETPNEAEETFNVSFYDSGFDAECEMVSEVQQGRLGVGTKLVEAGDSPRQPGFVWVVMDADYSGFGKRALRVKVKLIFREALNVAA